MCCSSRKRYCQRIAAHGRKHHFCVLKARGAVLNQLRADDLLVREHAGHSILQAAKKLQEQEADYARKFLPAPTRENPFPADDKLATHALIRSTRQNLLALEARIRGLSALSRRQADRDWLTVFPNRIGYRSHGARVCSLTIYNTAAAESTPKVR
jgi:hypothetical protein